MKSYTELVDSKASETDIRRYLVEGKRVSATMLIPNTLRGIAKDKAALRGMGFSVFVHTCMIEELAKKGA